METDKVEETALAEAIRRSGSKAELARRMGVHRRVVGQWTRIPAARIEKAHSLFPMISKKRLLAPHLEG